VNTRALCLSLLLVLPLAGCHGHSTSAPASAQAVADQHAVLEAEREQLDSIPPPSKNRYMAVHTYESWENPYVTVQAGMVTLHVLLADANTSDYGAGGILRPVGARRQELNLSMEKLGEAISAVPQTSWPYGRVIAIEEAHKVPASAQPQVRRTMETAVGTLNDLGIVVYDLNDGKLQ